MNRAGLCTHEIQFWGNSLDKAGERGAIVGRKVGWRGIPEVVSETCVVEEL